MTNASIERTNFDWTQLRVGRLIFQWMNAFEFQNSWNEAAEKNAVPWGSSRSSFAQNMEDMNANINFFISNQVMKEQGSIEIHVSGAW